MAESIARKTESTVNTEPKLSSYAIGCEGSNYVNIGCSFDIGRRLTQLQEKAPGPLRLLEPVSNKAYPSLYDRVHANLKKYVDLDDESAISRALELDVNKICEYWREG